MLMMDYCKAKAEQRPFLRPKLETDPKIILIYRHFDLQNDAKKTDGALVCFVGLFCSAPGMGNNLVVKVHYRLGSRNC